MTAPTSITGTVRTTRDGRGRPVGHHLDPDPEHDVPHSSATVWLHEAIARLADGTRVTVTLEVRPSPLDFDAAVEAVLQDWQVPETDDPADALATAVADAKTLTGMLLSMHAKAQHSTPEAADARRLRNALLLHAHAQGVRYRTLARVLGYGVTSIGRLVHDARDEAAWAATAGQ